MSTYTDPLDQLTVAELDAASRLLKTDVVTAVHERTQDRWQGLAIVAWQLAKRTDPTAQLATYRAMLPNELVAALGIGDDDQDDAPDAAATTPAADGADDADAATPPAASASSSAPSSPRSPAGLLAADVAANPTVRARV